MLEELQRRNYAKTTVSDYLKAVEYFRPSLEFDAAALIGFVQGVVESGPALLKRCASQICSVQMEEVKMRRT
jgi:hypothetical protein